jgi:hypothetical protein
MLCLDFRPCSCTKCELTEEECFAASPMAAAEQMLDLGKSDEILGGYFADHVWNSEEEQVISAEEELFCQESIEKKKVTLAEDKAKVENMEMQILSLENRLARKRFRETRDQGDKSDPYFSEKVLEEVKVMKLYEAFPRSTSPTFRPASP